MKLIACDLSASLEAKPPPNHNSLRDNRLQWQVNRVTTKVQLPQKQDRKEKKRKKGKGGGGNKGGVGGEGNTRPTQSYGHDYKIYASDQQKDMLANASLIKYTIMNKNSKETKKENWYKTKCRLDRGE